MPGSRVCVCVCTKCELCVCVNLRPCYCWAWLSRGNVNLVRFDCAYSCAHHNCVTDITCACLCCTCFFKREKSSLSSSCCLNFCKLSELSCGDLFWTGLAPQYLLSSQLMAPKDADIYVVTWLPSWTMYSLACRSCMCVLLCARSLFFICCWKPWSVVESWITEAYLWLGRSVCKEHPSTALHSPRSPTFSV